MRLLRRDLLRLLTVPTPWIFLMMGVALAVMTILGLRALTGRIPLSVSLIEVPPLMGLAGAAIIGADFRFGSVYGELFVVGGRLLYLTRHLAALALVGAGTGTIIGTAAVACLAATDRSLADASASLGDIPMSTVVASVWACLGGLLAVVVRNQVGAVATVVGYVYFLEPILVSGSTRLKSFMPAQVSADLLATPNWDTFLKGAPKLLVAVVLLGLLAWALFVRKRLAV
jgi:hypothetical protein